MVPIEPTDDSKRILTDIERNDILQTLLSMSINGKLPKCEDPRKGNKFNVSTKSISRIWHRAKECYDQGMTGEMLDSPDFNVLDLGFFNAIQSLQHQKSPKDIDELVDAVNTAFESMSAETLNNVFLSLQLAFESSMRVMVETATNCNILVKNSCVAKGTTPSHFAVTSM